MIGCNVIFKKKGECHVFVLILIMSGIDLNKQLIVVLVH